MRSLVKIWDVAKGTRVADTAADGRDLVNAVAFHPNGNVLVSAGDDCSVRMWNIDWARDVVSEMPPLAEPGPEVDRESPRRLTQEEVDGLIQTVTDPVADRWRDALKEITDKNEQRAVEPLCRFLMATWQNPSRWQERRIPCFEALCALGDPQAITSLCGVISDTADEAGCARLMELMVERFGEQVLGVTCQMLAQGATRGARLSAARALQSIGNSSVLPRLQARLHPSTGESDPIVKQAVSEAIASLRPPLTAADSAVGATAPTSIQFQQQPLRPPPDASTPIPASRPSPGRTAAGSQTRVDAAASEDSPPSGAGAIFECAIWGGMLGALITRYGEVVAYVSLAACLLYYWFGGIVSATSHRKESGHLYGCAFFILTLVLGAVIFQTTGQSAEMSLQIRNFGYGALGGGIVGIVKAIGIRRRG